MDRIITEGAELEAVRKFFPGAKSVKVCPSTRRVWVSTPNGSKDVRAKRDWTSKLGTCPDSVMLAERLLDA